MATLTHPASKSKAESSAADDFSPSETPCPIDVADAFFRELYGNNAPGYLTICFAKAGIESANLCTRWFRATKTRQAAEAAIKLSDEGNNVWFGVGLRKAPMSGRGGSADVIAIPALWSDIDIAHPVHKKSEKLPQTEVDAQKIVNAIDLAPSIILHSGHGLQSYHRLPSLWVFSDDADRENAQKLLNRFKATIAAKAAKLNFKVDAVADLARIMRVPGTMNWKEVTAPVPVTITDANEFHVYEPSEIDKRLLPEPVPHEEAAEPMPAGPREPEPRDIDDDAILDRAYQSNGGDKFRGLMDGSLAHYANDHSAADQGFANMLAFWFGKDKGRMDRVFRSSGLMRHKWNEKHSSDGRTYGEMTIDKAVADCRDTYDPSGKSASVGAVSSPKPRKIVFTPPISLDMPKPPDLPDGIFRFAMGAMIDAVAEAIEAPRDLPAAFALGAVATAVQKKLSIRIKNGYFEPLNLWIVCAMTPGNRKSEAMRRMVAPLAEWEQKQSAELLPLIEKVGSERKTIEARITRLRAEAAKAKAGEFAKLSAEIAELETTLPNVPKVRQLYTQDVTPEHLGTLLADNGEAMALLSDEGGLFDMMGGRYSDGLPNLDVYLQSHAGAAVRVNRGSRPSVNLSFPALTVAASPQPDVIRGLGRKQALRGRGAVARFLLLMPNSTLGYRTNSTPPVPQAVSEAYQNALMALANLAPDKRGDRDIPYTLMLSDGGLDEWNRFWSEIEITMRPGGRLERMTDWAGKLPGAVARIAGLLHCMDNATAMPNVRDIEAETMARAVTFGHYLIEHALIAFDSMGADIAMDAARDLWKSIDKARRPKFTLRDAWHPIRGTYKTVADAEPGIDILIDHSYIAEPPQAEDGSPRRKGRKPSREFIVNPALVEGWK